MTHLPMPRTSALELGDESGRTRTAARSPTVSGIFSVVAPASITAVRTSIRNGISLRQASSGENSTSSVKVRANLTASTAIFRTSAGSFLSLCFMWIGEVAMNVWIRRFFAGGDGLARRVDVCLALARARAAIVGPLTCSAIELGGLELRGRGDGKARLDDVHAQHRELPGDLEFLAESTWPPPATARRRVTSCQR